METYFGIEKWGDLLKFFALIWNNFAELKEKSKWTLASRLTTNSQMPPNKASKTFNFDRQCFVFANLMSSIRETTTKPTTTKTTKTKRGNPKLTPVAPQAVKAQIR